MKFMLSQSLAEVPVKYVSVKFGGLLAVLHGMYKSNEHVTFSKLLKIIREDVILWWVYKTHQSEIS